MSKGIGIFLLGMAGAGGAIDLDKSLLVPTVMMVIGILMIIASMWKETNEKEVNSDYRSSDFDSSSRPYFLRK